MVKQKFYKKTYKYSEKFMKFISVRVLLLVVSSFITLIISLSTLDGSTAQFIHLLRPSSLGTAVVAAAGQPQPSENPTLQSSVSTSSSPPSSSTSTSLPDIFQKVENSVVQITSTKSNPNEIIIQNGVPATGKSTALILDLYMIVRVILLPITML